MKNKKLSSYLCLASSLTLLSACNPASSVTAASTVTTETDVLLASLIAQNRIVSLPTVTAETDAIVSLGEKLFSDVNLSGPKNISCMSCHSTSQGLGDGMPFSVGTGATGVGSARQQVNGVSSATSRNAPSLYNLGQTNQLHAFFDGRVSFINNVVTSPVTSINGSSPVRSDITLIFKNVFDIQPLFPLLSSTEMLGTNNTLANISDSATIWDTILSQRLLNQTAYLNLFTNAYPTTATNRLNPGHIGRAIGAFMKSKFRSANSPFDQYLAGNLNALSTNAKLGMVTFFTKGQCLRCHGTSNFTDDNFHSVATPQIGLSPFTDDTGLYAQTGLSTDLYRFKTPSLRNLSLTSPYMHDGAFETIEAVVEHYNNVSVSLQNYQIPTSYQAHYQTALIKDSSTSQNQIRLNQVDNGALRNGLNLTTTEKANLVEFLRFGLRDGTFN